MTALFVNNTTKTLSKTNKLLWKWQEIDGGTIFTSAMETEMRRWREPISVIWNASFHSRCALVLPHIILYLHCKKKYNYQPLVPSEERKKQPPNEGVHACCTGWSRRPQRPRWTPKRLLLLFSFSFFLATWKYILHLAHISWILCTLKQNLRA